MAALKQIARLMAAVAAAAASGAAQAADPAHPTVVELFQSQGCSSCPPANANVLALAGRPDILTLSWQVTYWDNLGWKDTFGQPAFTARQWQYAHAFHRGEVATPEVVVNGRADVVGSRRDELERLIRQADRGAGGPQVRIEGLSAAVSGQGPVQGPAGRVVLVRYDPDIVNVPIQAGENGGVTLPHRNVVRQVADLGAWSGGARSYALPPPTRPGLKTAILVQQGPGGPILAAVHD
jgi:hypothetical protein